MTEPEKKSTYITGHCSNGACEGSKKLSASGVLMQPCRGTYQYRGKVIKCTHNCHDAFAQIRELLGDIAGSFMSPDPAMVAHIPPSTATGSVIGDVGAASEPVTATVRPTVLPFGRALRMEQPTGFKATPSGRQARGQLEEDVRLVVKEHHEQARGLLTPKIIAMFIDKMRNKEKPTSQGAVHAVIMRWVDGGLATISEKPFRFDAFTEEGKRKLLH